MLWWAPMCQLLVVSRIVTTNRIFSILYVVVNMIGHGDERTILHWQTKIDRRLLIASIPTFTSCESALSDYAMDDYVSLAPAIIVTNVLLKMSALWTID